jgi:hypothetical protein
MFLLNGKTGKFKGLGLTPNPLFLLVEPRGIEPLAYALRILRPGPAPRPKTQNFDIISFFILDRAQW